MEMLAHLAVSYLGDRDMQLGRKIREIRLRRGLTVQQLGERTGLSKGFISQVENSRTSPSLATLHDIARALQTSVAVLVVEEGPAPYVVRADARPRVQVGDAPARTELLSAQPRRCLELVEVALAPGAPHATPRHDHPGEEVVLCLSGRVTLLCGEHQIVLSAGDSVHFDGRVPHSIENHEDATAKVLIAMASGMGDPMGSAPGLGTHGLDLSHDIHRVS